MRTRFLILLILALSTSLFAQTAKKPAPKKYQGPPRSQAEADQRTQEDREAIEKLHDTEIKAHMAVDIPALESLWTDDVVNMPPNHEPIVGRAANNEYLEAATKGLANVEILAYDETWQEVQQEGDLAYVYGTIVGRSRPMAGGNEVETRYNMVRILRRQPDGAWLISRAIWNDANPLPKPKAPEPPKAEEKKENKLEK